MMTKAQLTGWVCGAAINMVGSVLINLGTNVMKLGHNRRSSSELPEIERPAIREFREWQIGVALFGAGNVLNFVSFGFAAQSLLAALGSIQFVTNVVFAWLVLQEKATNRVLMATLLICIGCILLVTFGNHQSPTLDVDDLLMYYRSGIYLTYMTVLLAASAVSYVVYRHGKLQLALVGADNVASKWARLLPVCYALFSGMIGTQSVLFAKMLSTLLRTTYYGESQLSYWFTWASAGAFLLSASFWISRLNKALKLFPAIVIVPTMQISWTFFSILSGGMYFQEYAVFTALSGTMFVVGVLHIFAGVWLLTPDTGREFRGMKDLEEECAKSLVPGRLAGGGAAPRGLLDACLPDAAGEGLEGLRQRMQPLLPLSSWLNLAERQKR